RNPMLVKRLDDAVRGNRREENDGRAEAKRTQTVCNERQHMGKRQDRKNPMIGAEMQVFEDTLDLIVEVVEGQLDAFGVARRAGREEQEPRFAPPVAAV